MREDRPCRGNGGTGGSSSFRNAGSQTNHPQTTSNAPFADREVIAVVKKNKTDEIRIAFTTYEGMNLLDARVFSAFGGSNPRPTKKGITVRIEKLPALIDGLQAALAEAQRRGLIKAEVLS